MDILIYIFILGSAFLILLYLSTKDKVRLSDEIKKELVPDYDYRLRKNTKAFKHPLFYINQYILNRIGRQGVEDRLKMAEVDLLAEDYLSIKEVVCLAIFLLLFLVGKGTPPALFLGAVLFGFVLPDVYLTKRIQDRKKAIIRLFPETIDLLKLCVDGGMDFVVGLNWIVQRSTGNNPLVKELRLVLNEVNMGKARGLAFKEMAKRLKIQEVSSFVNTLVHAERMGTPISEILSALSDETRDMRFQRGERRALQAPIKMLFPLILFILPVVGIIIGGPILLQFLQTGLPKF